MRNRICWIVVLTGKHDISIDNMMISKNTKPFTGMNNIIIYDYFHFFSPFHVHNIFNTSLSLSVYMYKLRTSL